jgi:hypothetical protein
MGLLRALGWLLIAAAIASAAFGTHSIWDGTRPLAGGGAPVHVGMIIAGIIAWLATILLGGLGYLVLRRAATPPAAGEAGIRAAPPPGPDNG